MRRVWVITQKEELEQKDLDDALLNGCPEVANGIPPALEKVVSLNQLPFAYQEPKPPKLPIVPDYKADWIAADTADKKLDVLA